jgi:light-regulated signal transduction histidine kinase (bacteriophytochrome)
MSAKGVELPADVDLTNCAQEPIHNPGLIQPHGVLLALDEENLAVLQASANAGEILGRPDDDLPGARIGDLLGPYLARSIRAWAETSLDEPNPSYLATIAVGGRDHARPFDAIIHRSEGVHVLELEPSSGSQGSFLDVYPLIRGFLDHHEGTSSLEEVCGRAATEIRRITSFDRVLIYQFNEEWDGTVIAEDRNDALPSYLGLRFPAADIPAQARELYRLSRVRLIADVDYTPVPIVPPRNPLTGRALDLSHATLRSVSKVHLEYMANMGTAASMSISIIRDGRLWGLISCHNRTPKFAPFAVRTACDLLGQILALQIAAKQQQAEFEQKVIRKEIQPRLLAAMADAEEFVEGLVRLSGDLLSLAGADGAVILHDGQCIRIGRTPDEEQVGRIADWLEHAGRDDLFVTDSLPRHLPWADGIKDLACGLLAIATSKIHRGYLMWFRPEVIRTVRWAGDPVKPKGDDEGRIHPRKSFESWKETVKQRSRGWLSAEIEAATELRNAIVGIVLKRAEERAELSAELERSNCELEAFSYSVSHDLRAPFRHIVGYSEMLREMEETNLSTEGKRFVDTIIDSAQYAGTLVDNLLAFSRMGRTTIHPVPIDMNTLTREVIRDVMLESGDRKVTWDVGDLPPVEGDLMMIRLAVSNLASNALKYTRPRAEAVIQIRGETSGAESIFSVRDNGIGFDMRYADKLFGVFQRLHRMEEFEGTGIGLANVRRIVARHGGRVWGEGQVDRGATFSFALPSLGSFRSERDHASNLAGEANESERN